MSLSFLQTASTTTGATTFTFSSQNLGTASSDRYIIVGIGTRKAGTTGQINSVTVGGVSATIVGQTKATGDSNNSTAGMAIALVPTGTTGDVVVTMSEAFLRMGISLWSATSLSSITPTDSGTSNASDPTDNLNISAGGFAIGYSFAGSNVTATWTGLTENFDTNFQTNASHTGASQTFDTIQTGRTITADWTGGTTNAGVFASWLFATAQLSNIQSISNINTITF